MFRLHGLFLDIVTDSLNILPPLLYARVVTGHSWGMFLDIDLWGQRAYVLSRQAVPLVAIPTLPEASASFYFPKSQESAIGLLPRSKATDSD